MLTNARFAYYGHACAASGAYFACSAYRFGTGFVAVYKMDVARANATLLQIIQPDLGAGSIPRFGWSMDMDGDLLVASAYSWGEAGGPMLTGLVFAYKRNANDVYQLLGNRTAPDVAQRKRPVKGLRWL